MNKRVVILISFILVCLLFAVSVEAAPRSTLSDELHLSTHFIGKLLRGICLAAGIGCMISSILKYKEYRCHEHVRFSLIFFLFLTGVALIGLGFLPYPEAGH